MKRLVLFLCSVAAITANANDISNVDPSTPVAIQTWIDRTDTIAGDTCRLRGGDFSGTPWRNNVLVNKPVHIIGNGNTENPAFTNPTIIKLDINSQVPPLPAPNNDKRPGNLSAFQIQIPRGATTNDVPFWQISSMTISTVAGAKPETNYGVISIGSIFGSNLQPENGRIDHITMTVQNQTMIRAWNAFFVVDHNRFHAGGQGNFTQYQTGWVAYGGPHVGQSGSKGAGSWSDLPYWGTGRAVYYEDNYQDGNANQGFDGNDGNRMVIRHNRLGFHIGGHGTDSGNYRGTKQAETYNNIFGAVPTGALSPNVVEQVRSGTRTTFSNLVDQGGQDWKPPAIFGGGYLDRLTQGFVPWGEADGRNPMDDNDGVTYDTGTVQSISSNTASAVQMTVSGINTATNWHGYILCLDKIAQSFTIATASQTIQTSAVNAGNSSLVDLTLTGKNLSPLWNVVVNDTFKIFRIRHIMDCPGCGQSDLLTNVDPNTNNPGANQDRGGGKLWVRNDIPETGGAVSPHQPSTLGDAGIYSWNNATLTGTGMNGYSTSLSGGMPYGTGRELHPDEIRPNYPAPNPTPAPSSPPCRIGPDDSMLKGSGTFADAANTGAQYWLNPTNSDPKKRVYGYRYPHPNTFGQGIGSVGPPPPQLTGPSSATYIVGQAGAAQVFTASNFTAAPTISISSGTLPSGVSFVPSGLTATISGTPTTNAGSPYAVTIRAIQGSEVATHGFTLTVNAANQPPTATLTQPPDGTHYFTGTVIPLNCTTGDTDGAVTSVTYYRDAAPAPSPIVTVASTNPSFPASTWTGAAVGSYTITVKATDNGSPPLTSALINSSAITVGTPTPTPTPTATPTPTGTPTPTPTPSPSLTPAVISALP